jgi:hypothetical protein
VPSKPIRSMDDYMDALDRGLIAPERETTCPECGGVMHVRAQEVGDTLRLWMNCDQCKMVNHGDRGPKFPGWEVLA